MTREERLSLAIARHFEKEPTWKQLEKSREYLGTFYSTGGWWQRRFEYGEVKEATARSITEPEIAMKLQGMLIDKLGIESAFTEIHMALLDFAETNELYSAHLAQAIAEAFAKAFNLEV